MLKMKKVLSVALVVVMLLSIFAVNTFALVDGKEFGMVLVSDKTEKEIVPGAAVTVTLYFEMADYSQLMSDMKICLLYDKNVYTPDLDSRSFIGDLANYAKDGTKPNINANYATAVMNASTMADDEKTLYNSGVMQQILSDASLGATNKAGYSVTQDTATGMSVAQMTFTFNVTGDEAALASGNKNIKICDAYNSNQTIKKTTGSATPTYVSSFDATNANIMANMPVVTGPAVTKAKSQVKMTPISATTVADDFSFRVISTITDADWDAYFANTGVDGATTSYITAVGMVAYKGDTFDADTAKAVVAGTKTDADYGAATTDYICKASDDADATFGTVILAKHSTLNADVTYMGFVQYVDADGAAQTIFYETAGTAALSSNYDNIVSAYLAAYPYAA